MLPAAARLRRAEDFTRAVRGGRRAGRPTLVLHLQLDEAGRDGVTTGTDGVAPRVGFVVSRAVGVAVVRNRVRRRLRHVMRDRLSRLPARAVLVVRALPTAAGASSAVLAADLEAAFGRLGLPAGSSAAAPQPPVTATRTGEAG